MGQESSNRWCLLSQFSVKVLAQSMPNFHLILDEKLDELHLHLSTEALIYFREKYAIISKARVTYIGIPESFVLFLDHCVLMTRRNRKYFIFYPKDTKF